MTQPEGRGTEAWEVLADGTRRRLITMLLEAGDASATELAAGVSISRQGVLKHLLVLERVGLVHRRTAGREVRFGVDDRRLAGITDDMAAAARGWDARLHRIRDLAEGLAQEQDRAT